MHTYTIHIQYTGTHIFTHIHRHIHIYTYRTDIRPSHTYIYMYCTNLCYHCTRGVVSICTKAFTMCTLNYAYAIHPHIRFYSICTCKHMFIGVCTQPHTYLRHITVLHVHNVFKYKYTRRKHKIITQELYEDLLNSHWRLA